MKDVKFYAQVLGFVVLLSIGYGCWTAGRHINYLWQYEDMVRATVAEMVKPEALKEKE